jgi:hypothetical protein
MSNKGWLMLFLLGIAFVANPEDIKPKAENNNNGKTTSIVTATSKDGNNVEYTIEANKGVYFPLEPIEIAVTITNRSTNVITYVDTGLPFRDGKYRVIDKQNGVEVPLTLYGANQLKLPFYKRDFIPVVPGGELKRNFILNRMFDMSLCSDYIVKWELHYYIEDDTITTIQGQELNVSIIEKEQEVVNQKVSGPPTIK